MTKDENGFAVLEAILIVVMLGIIGFTGWFVLNTRKNIDKSLDSNNSSAPVVNKEKTEAKAIGRAKTDTSVHEVDIKLQTTSDLDKLPDYTPVSFKVYMEKTLTGNTFSYSAGEDTDTITQYLISKISQVNVSGGQETVDKNGQGHPGGAPAIWVLTPSGTWDQETLNWPVCKSKNGGLVYEEFVKECHIDSSFSELIKNPNGSIITISN